MPQDQYQDKTQDQIKTELKSKFNENGKFLVNDEKEIYQEWVQLLENLQKEIKEKHQMYRERYNQENDLFQSIKQQMKLFEAQINQNPTSRCDNDQVLDTVSKQINEAEKKVLDLLKKLYTNDQRDDKKDEIRDKKSEQQTQARIEKETGKKLYTIDKNGAYCLTKHTNKLTIHELLGKIAHNQWIFKIDYSQCKNPRLKQAVIKKIWWTSCWTTFDRDQKTFCLRDQKWKRILQRAWIAEGVKIIKEDKVQLSAHDKEVLCTIREDSREKIPNSSIPNLPEFKNFPALKQAISKTSSWNVDICASYANCIISEILSRKWVLYQFPGKDARELTKMLKEQSTWQFTIKESLNENEQISQNDILTAPAGSFLTVQYEKSWHKSEWVTHVWISLGNWVYTDLLWSQKRVFTLTRKNFQWNQLVIDGKKYSFDHTVKPSSPALMTPNPDKFPKWRLQRITAKDLHISLKERTPAKFIEELHKRTKLPQHYIRMKIAEQNKISLADTFSQKKTFPDLSVTMIANFDPKQEERTFHEYDSGNKEQLNDVATKFLEWIKENKVAIMEHFPSITSEEYDKIADRALGILYQETNAGDSITYKGKESWHSFLDANPLSGVSLIKNIYEYFKWEYSRWYTQIKLHTLFWQDGQEESRHEKFLKEKLWINSPDDLTDAKKCGAATMTGLVINYLRYIVPMKTDSYRKNDAEIISLTFNDGEREDIAPWASVPMQWWRRKRTKEEVENLIQEWAEKHWWIKERKTEKRAWIKNNDDFYDYLYYTWNQPSELAYGTATLTKNQYANQATAFVDSHTGDKAQDTA